MRATISLTTDFGYDDPYVGMMKGVILGLNPDASLVDICHNIPPGNIALAGLFLAGAAPYFPAGSVHLAVVDPGVGSSRRCLAARTRRASFVAPDNGLLTAALADNPPDEIVELTNPEYWLPSPSPTFHGRDIMGPVAAHISLGIPLCEFGPPVMDPVKLETPHPQRQPDGSLIGQVVHTDRFGNLITNIRPADLPGAAGGQSKGLILEIAGQPIRGLSRHYSEGSGLLALVGSTGFIEIALRDGSAAQALQIGRGETVLAYLQ